MPNKNAKYKSVYVTKKFSDDLTFLMRVWGLDASQCMKQAVAECAIYEKKDVMRLRGRKLSEDELFELEEKGKR